MRSPAAVAPAPNRYQIGLDKNPANYAPLTPLELPRLDRRRLSRTAPP